MFPKEPGHTWQVDLILKLSGLGAVSLSLLCQSASQGGRWLQGQYSSGRRKTGTFLLSDQRTLLCLLKSCSRGPPLPQVFVHSFLMEHLLWIDCAVL